MPRVVLVATDPDLELSELTAPLSDWEGEPLAPVLVALHRVSGVEALDPDDPWPPPPDIARPTGVRGRCYDEVRAPTGPRPASARTRRLQDEAAAQERGRRLWDLMSADGALVPLLVAADAIAATDLGGIRSAFHLARRHDIPVATNGLVPCLVELAARAGRGGSQSSEDSGGEADGSRPL